MSEQTAQFEAAAAEAQKLPKKPDNEILLKLYSLYKQATAGNVSGARPGFTDIVGQAKYTAWAKLKGMSKEDAMKAYISLVAKLKG